MSKLLIVFIFFTAILQKNIYGQNVKTLDYYLTKDSITGLLPFDQHFRLRVLELDNVTELSLKIYEIKKYNYKKLWKESHTGPTRTKRELDFDIIANNKATLVFSSRIFTTADFHDNTCKIDILPYLLPDSRYILVLNSPKLIPISEEKKAELVLAIETDASINTVINDEIIKNIQNPRAATALNWSRMTTDLSLKADGIIRAINSQYLIRTDIDYEVKLREINQVLLSGLTVSRNLNILSRYYNSALSISDTAMRSTEIKRLSKDSAAFSQMLIQTDWFVLQDNDDANYDMIIEALDKIINVNNVNDLQKKQKLFELHTSIKDQLKKIIKAKNNFINLFVMIKVGSVSTGSAGGSTYSPDFVERAKQHVTFDLGYAYVWGIDRGNAYASMNIYFRSVDTSLPLKNYRANFKDYMGSHFSLLIGLSVESIQKDSVRKGLLGNGSALITGIGYKLLPWFKINSGAYWYYKYPVNPLLNKDRLRFTGSPFVSLSIDVNLGTLFNSFSNGNIFKQL